MGQAKAWNLSSTITSMVDAYKKRAHNFEVYMYCAPTAGVKEIQYVVGNVHVSRVLVYAHRLD